MAVKKAAKRSAASDGRRKLTTAELARQVSAVSAAIEKHRRENKGEFFEALSPEDIEKKLKRVNTPFINSQAFGSAPAGGSFALSVGVFNPDPVTVGSMYVHVYAGPALVVTDIGTALLNVDTRFNRLTEPPPSGLSLASGASGTLTYTFRVPAGMDRSTYLVSCVLLQRQAFDPGTVFDRSFFPFRVT